VLNKILVVSQHVQSIAEMNLTASLVEYLLLLIYQLHLLSLIQDSLCALIMLDVAIQLVLLLNAILLHLRMQSMLMPWTVAAQLYFQLWTFSAVEITYCALMMFMEELNDIWEGSWLNA